jgi:hypothetical protein
MRVCTENEHCLAIREKYKEKYGQALRYVYEHAVKNAILPRRYCKNKENVV